MFMIMKKYGKIQGETLWSFDFRKFETVENAIDEILNMCLNGKSKVSDYTVVEIVSFEGEFKVSWESMKKD